MFGFRKLRNNSRRRRSAAKINGPESLETRELMTVTASMNSAGLLSVRGSEMPDKITVFQISGNFFVQSLDAANVPTNRNMGSGVTSLDIRTFGGNDSVTNLTNLKATILTGNGDDTVVGGSNDDLIYTEAGNDTAIGNNGNDSIYGGAGIDRLFGKDGNDYIMGDDWTLNALTPA